MGFIENILEDYIRKQALKIMTYKLGRVTEDMTTIYCFVDEKNSKISMIKEIYMVLI